MAQKTPAKKVQKALSGPNAEPADVFQCCTGTGGNHTHGPPGLDPHRKGSAWSITNMPPDIAELAIDRPFNRDMKVFLSCLIISVLKKYVLCNELTV